MVICKLVIELIIFIKKRLEKLTIKLGPYINQGKEKRTK